MNTMKKNYSINSSSKDDSLIKNNLFKHALKCEGPINQVEIIHHDKNVRKSMAYPKPLETTTYNEKEKNKKINDININYNITNFINYNPIKKKVNSKEQINNINLK